MSEFGAEDFGENDDMEQNLPSAGGDEAPLKKKKKKKKAAPMVQETDNPLFPMGESREKGDGKLDGLGAKEELNEGLSQLQDFVATTMTTDEEAAIRAHRRSPPRPRFPSPCDPPLRPSVHGDCAPRGRGGTDAPLIKGAPPDLRVTHGQRKRYISCTRRGWWA